MPQLPHLPLNLNQRLLPSQSLFRLQRVNLLHPPPQEVRLQVHQLAHPPLYLLLYLLLVANRHPLQRVNQPVQVLALLHQQVNLKVSVHQLLYLHRHPHRHPPQPVPHRRLAPVLLKV